MPQAREPATTPRSRRTRPSFDVARADVGGRDARWVYRSDAGTPDAADAVERAAPHASTGPVADHGVAVPVEQVAAPPARSATAPRERSAACSVSRTGKSMPGWIETGVSIMVAPLAFTMVAMIAPVVWIVDSRTRH